MYPPPNQGQGSKQSQLNCRAGLVLATPLTGQQVQGVQVQGLSGRLSVNCLRMRGKCTLRRTLTRTY